MCFFGLGSAACKWILDQHSRTPEDTDNFIKHLGYMCMQGEQNAFKAKAHVAYDRHVRETADKLGWAAFSTGNVNATMQHYSISNLVTSNVGGKGKGQNSSASKSSSKKGQKKGACQAWNYYDGCSAGAKCTMYHSCATCYSVDHAAKSCPNPSSQRYKQARR